MKHISNPQKRKGISLIWVALTFLVMFAIGGLMLDWAHVYLVGHQLHNVADAAALAGSRYVPDPNSSPAGYTARLKAQEYANANFAAKLSVNLNPNGDTLTEVDIDMMLPEATLYSDYFPASKGDIYIGRYIDDSRLFIKNDPYPDAMLVVTRKFTGQANDPLPLLFAPIVTTFYGGPTISSAGIQKYAVAKIDNPYGAGVLALGKCSECPGLLFDGGGADEDLIILGGGSLYVNSGYVDLSGKSGAIDQSGNAKIVLDLDRVYAVGSIDDKMDILEDTDVHLGADPEPDPYADVPNAVYSTTPDLGTMDASGTYAPGYYSGGIQISGGITVNLEPGNYYLDSVDQAASLGMTGGLITGEGVTLHIIGDADKGVDVQGGASDPVNMDISAPTSGPYAGIAIFQKRNPAYDCVLSCSDVPVSEFNGHGNIDIDGAIYMPHNKLTLGGTGDILVTRTVADRFVIKGTGQKLVDYKGDPKIATKSYLVE